MRAKVDATGDLSFDDRVDGGRGATVLVVDDDEDVRAVAVAALEGRFRVLEARNGDEALALLEGEGGIDVIVTDVVMPGISGLHILRKAQQYRPPPKVLLMSGFAPALVDTQYPNGAFLPKPFRLRDLESAVLRLLER